MAEKTPKEVWKGAGRLFGSLDLTVMLEQLKAKHSAFTRSDKNGHIYMAVTEWVNDEPNDFKQHASVLLSSKDAVVAKEEGKVYIGNLIKGGENEAKPIGEEVNKEVDDALSGLDF